MVVLLVAFSQSRYDGVPLVDYFTGQSDASKAADEASTSAPAVPLPSSQRKGAGAAAKLGTAGAAKHKPPMPQQVENAKLAALAAKKVGYELRNRFRAKSAASTYTSLGSVGVLVQAQGDSIDEAVALVRNMRMTTLIKRFTIFVRRRHKAYLEDLLETKPYVKIRCFEDLNPKRWSNCSAFHNSVFEKLVALNAMQSTYDTTIVVSPYIHVCNGLESLLPKPARDFDVAFATTYFSRWPGTYDVPNFNVSLGHTNALHYGKPFAWFPERNTDFMVLRTNRKKVRELTTTWQTLYQKAMDDGRCKEFGTDMPALREALFVHREAITEAVLPRDRVCREGNRLVGCTLREVRVSCCLFPPLFCGRAVTHTGMRNRRLCRRELQHGSRRPRASEPSRDQGTAAAVVGLSVKHLHNARGGTPVSPCPRIMQLILFCAATTLTRPSLSYFILIFSPPPPLPLLLP